MSRCERPGALVLAVALLAGSGLVACQSSGGAGEGTKVTNDAGTLAHGSEPQGDGSLPQARWVTPVDPAFPLAKYAQSILGSAGSNGDGGLVADRSAWNDRVESHKASCMKQQGFQYFPRPYAADSASSDSTATEFASLAIPLLPDSRSVAEDQGYGLMAAPDAADASDGNDQSDKNVDYVETLAGPQRTAYERALYGETQADGTTKGGCATEALAKYPEPPDQAGAPSRQDNYGDLLASMYQSVSNDLLEDSRVVSLNQAWYSCMAEAGFDFGAAASGGGPVDAIDQAIRTRPNGTVGLPQPDTPTANIPVDEKSLLGVPAERQIALADFDCRAATDYVEVLTTARRARDNAFIAANQTRLDAMVAEGR